MSFGFSVSDVWALVEFGWQIVSSLKEDGGSKEDFRAQAALRRALRDALVRVRADITSVDLEAEASATIHRQIDTLISEVQRLDERVAKSEPYLGLKSRDGWYREILRKLLWQLRAKNERQRISDLLKLVSLFACETNA